MLNGAFIVGGDDNRQTKAMQINKIGYVIVVIAVVVAFFYLLFFVYYFYHIFDVQIDHDCMT